jgi:hypothetical protein
MIDASSINESHHGAKFSIHGSILVPTHNQSIGGLRIVDGLLVVAIQDAANDQ